MSPLLKSFDITKKPAYFLVYFAIFGCTAHQSNMNIVVGIITYNRKQLLADCLGSVRASIPPGDGNTWSIIVSDDGSTDGTHEYLHEQKNRADFAAGKVLLKVLCAEDYGGRGGVARNSNRVIKAALELKADVLFLLNDDVVVGSSEAFTKYIRTWQLTGIQHFAFTDPNSVHKPINRNRVIDGELNRIDVEYRNLGDGAFLFFSKEALETLGGFNTEYAMFGGEHCEMTARAVEAGLCPGVVDLAEMDQFIRARQYYEQIPCSVGYERAKHIAHAQKQWVKFMSGEIEIHRPVIT